MDRCCSLGLDCRVCSIAAVRPASSFQFLWAPHTKHGPPGDLLGVLGHVVRAAARLFRQLRRRGRSRAKRIGGGFCGGHRGGGGFRGDDSSTAAAASAAAASAAATSATSAAVSVRAVKISARLIERASDTRSRSCAN